MDQKVATLIREQCRLAGAWTGQPKDPVLNAATVAGIARYGMADFIEMKTMILGGLDS